MTAVLRAIKRHDTSEEWVMTGGVSPSNAACSESWTILSEAQVDISYKAALSASPVTTAPCSPEMTCKPAEKRCSLPDGPFSSICNSAGGKSARPAKTIEEQRPAASESDDGCEMYRMRKGRVAGGNSSKSRNNRRK